MRSCLPLAILLLVLVPCHALAAAPVIRPYSGCGVLAMSGRIGDGEGTLVLYREPGVERLAELNSSALPRLAGSAREPLLAVHARKGRWTRVDYDDAGRRGWVEQSRWWEYHPWEEFLPGRMLRILPGMKKGLYLLKNAPSEQGADLATVARDQTVRVLRVENDWVRLQAPAGWFRWRDADGRLTVSLPAETGREKR